MLQNVDLGQRFFSGFKKSGQIKEVTLRTGSPNYISFCDASGFTLMYIITPKITRLSFLPSLTNCMQLLRRPLRTLSLRTRHTYHTNYCSHKLIHEYTSQRYALHNVHTNHGCTTYQIAEETFSDILFIQRQGQHGCWRIILHPH